MLPFVFFLCLNTINNTTLIILMAWIPWIYQNNSNISWYSLKSRCSQGPCYWVNNQYMFFLWNLWNAPTPKSKTSIEYFPHLTNEQLYGCSRQFGRPVGAWCSMGFGPNPLIKRLIQHTFKLKILFLENFTVIYFDKTKLFFYLSQVTMMFQKKRFFENIKKSEWDFQLGTSLSSPPSKKKQVALKKSLRLQTCEAPRNGCINFLKKK